MLKLHRIFLFFIFLVASVSGTVSHAGTPTYVGPWVYTFSPDMQPAEQFSSQEAAVNRIVAYWKNRFDTAVIYTPACNFRRSPDPFLYAYQRTVEGVESYSAGYFSIRYDRYCDGRPLPQPGDSGYPGTQDIVGTINQSRLVCASTQHYYNQKCVDATPANQVGDNGANFGKSCPFCGAPINPSTGNMWHVENDAIGSTATSQLTIERTYNSSMLRPDANKSRNFGSSWTVKYDAAISPTVARTAANPPSQCWRLVSDPTVVFCDNAIPPADTLTAVSVSRSDGKSYVFQLQADKSWSADSGTNDRLTAKVGSDGLTIVGWIYVSAENGSTEQFDSTGRLLSIASRSGQTQTLTYSAGDSNDTTLSRYPLDAPVCTKIHPGEPVPAGRLLCITDQWGLQLQFVFDVKGRVIQTLDSNDQSTAYEYDGPSGGCTADTLSSDACKADNLTKVTYPDGGVRTYVYNERAQLNSGNPCSYNPPAISTNVGWLPRALTGLIDENGVRYISWTYSCGGLATSSQLANGVEKVTLSYTSDLNLGLTYASIYDFVGDPTSPESINALFTAKPIGGIFKNIGVSRTCVECGRVKSRTYDDNGNVLTSKDFLGVQTNYQYDLARNLQTNRVEAVGTTEARTVSTEWHPLFRLIARIAEPKRITSYTYDLAGNLLSRLEETTNDLNGASAFNATRSGKSRIWRYTYNQFGQLLSVTGPRTDTLVQTVYAYDSMGNLVSVTDPLGRRTSFSNYAPGGQVGTVTEPNGTVTQLTYTPRGWLSSQSITIGEHIETTSFAYDGVGQVRRVTLPDQSFIDYVYDDAHRLTKISDSLGNSINYTLDLRGNRLREQNKDPNGALQRQITRQFNNYHNQLFKQTGGSQ